VNLSGHLRKNLQPDNETEHVSGTSKAARREKSGGKGILLINKERTGLRSEKQTPFRLGTRLETDHCSGEGKESKANQTEEGGFILNLGLPRKVNIRAGKCIPNHSRRVALNRQRSGP